MTDKLFADIPEAKPLLGLVKKTTVLRHKKMGLEGVFLRVIVVNGRTRYRVRVTDAGESGFEVGAPVSDWGTEEKWEKVE